MEQQRLLRHVRDLPAQAALLHLRDVLAVYPDGPGLDVGEAQQQTGERRLPLPDWPTRPTFSPGWIVKSKCWNRVPRAGRRGQK